MSLRQHSPRIHLALAALALALALAGCSGKSANSNALGAIFENSADSSASARPAGIFTFDLTRYPREIRPKLLAEAAEGIACSDPDRSGPQTIAACDRLLAIHKELETRGWCRGPTAMPVDRRTWMRCGREASPQY
jgi:hypothetical protein